MKNILIVLIAFVSFSTFAQQTDYYLKKGYVAEGYDVTEYFNNKAVEGNKEFTTTYDGVKFKFASQANLDKFKASPDMFLPQYGGYCAYAVADKGKKVSVDPETFEIRDGKLYLFYNSWGTNTLEKWIEEGPEKLKGQADAAWNKVKYNK
ncbi:YHS domain-containing (seleno)protein [Dokdonia sp.]|uniref:YHS domain-containing (seleno)protein n=1 Tax=Dokdonia sp. TaxID=2024995 RepID=UPI003264F06C